MNFIKEKKINKYIVIAVLFLSFGFSEFHAIRGYLALVTASGSFVFNDVWAFVLAALAGGLIYEGITALLFRSSSVKLGGKGKDFQYALRFFYIAANLCSGALKILYLFYPYVYNYGELFFHFIFAAVFFALYLWYCCKTYCIKEEYGRIIMTMGSTFLCFYGFIAVITLISGVLA